MKIKIASSIKTEIADNLKELESQFEGFEKKLVLFFASSIYNPQQLSEEFDKTFKGVQTFGCSTSGEIISGKLMKNSIVAMAFDGDAVKNIKIEIMENISKDHNISKAFESFEKHYNTPMKNMDFMKYLGIILIDGLSGCEEKIMEQIGAMTNVIFIGGSAGDDLKFKTTYVYANGKSYANAALLALMEPGMNFDFIKTQSFCELQKKLVATSVNEENREVMEFNGKPAKVAYAEALRIAENEISDHFMSNPVGLMVEDEPYVRSPQQISGNGIKFYCNVLKDMELSVLKSTDIVNDTKKAINDYIKSKGNIAALINFHCILRTLDLEKSGRTDDYGMIFKDIPTIGFSTYGEQYIGHINQTSTMIAFYL